MEQVERRQIQTNQRLSQEKEAIDAEYRVKREELLREQTMSQVSLTALERVLDEV